MSLWNWTWLVVFYLLLNQMLFQFNQLAIDMFIFFQFNIFGSSHIVMWLRYGAVGSANLHILEGYWGFVLIVSFGVGPQDFFLKWFNFFETWTAGYWSVMKLVLISNTGSNLHIVLFFWIISSCNQAVIMETRILELNLSCFWCHMLW